MQQELDKIKNELKLRNYSSKTIKSYLLCLKYYFTYNSNYRRLNESNIKNFLLKLQSSKKSPQTINLYLNSIKHYYHEVFEKSH